MRPTEQYIHALASIGLGAKAQLRTLAGKGLDETVDGFDLFAGLWWPLRRETENAPRREVSWLLAKLFGAYPLTYESGATLPRRLQHCRPPTYSLERFVGRIDRMLLLPLSDLEPHLRWALRLVASRGLSLDWVQLANDLSAWERVKTRLEWARQFLGE